MTKLIDRIAARLGFVRLPAGVKKSWLPAQYQVERMTELVVFRNYSEARRAGFVGDRHPRHPHIKAWWPDSGMRGLAMRPFQRVTIPSGMEHLRIGGEGRLVDILRARMRVYGDDTVWIEL